MADLLTPNKLPDLPEYSGEPIDVLIIGFGAVGIMYGYALEKYKRARVTAIARSTYDTINKTGITIRSQKWGTIEGWKPHRVAKTIDEVLDTKFDFVFISTKLVPEVTTTDRVLGPLITNAYKHPQPAYVLLQNGLGVEKDLYRALKENHSQPPVVISTALYIACNVIGVEVTHGPFDKIAAGVYRDGYIAPSDLEPNEKKAADALVELIKGSNSGIEIVPHVGAAKFSKNLINASMGMISALTRASPSDWFNSESGDTGFDLIQDLIDEQIAVARAMGYDESLVSKAQAEQAKIMIRGNHNGLIPSALLDVRAGKPMELETVLGEVVREGRARNVPIPLLDFTYKTLSITQSYLLKQTQGK